MSCEYLNQICVILRQDHFLPLILLLLSKEAQHAMALVSTQSQLRTISPGPERFITMNLMSAGPCTVNKHITSYGRTIRRLKTRDNYTTADVQESRPFINASTLTNKPDLFGVLDIEGTSSKHLHRDTNKPDRQLYHDDIEGSRPLIKGGFKTNRFVDPQEPRYTLPSFMPAPIPPPNFTRDSFDVSDIEGTKSRPLYLTGERKNHVVDDIEGAQSGWKPRHVRARREAPPSNHSLDVSDIVGGSFQSQRTTNPLAPSYRVNGMDIADDPIKSRPRALPKARNSPFYPLTTEDIEGAQPGWRPMPKMHPPLEARRHFRNTNFMGDIPGAQADTVKHSICTNRHVNPLNPVYASLDGEPLPYPQTPLYNEPPCREAEAQLERIIAAEENPLPRADRSAGGPCTESRRRTASSEADCARNRFVHQGERGESDFQRVRPSSEPLASIQSPSGKDNHGSSRGRTEDEQCRDGEKNRERSPAGECSSTPEGKRRDTLGSSACRTQRPRMSDELRQSPRGRCCENNARVKSWLYSEPEEMRIGMRSATSASRELRARSSNVFHRTPSWSRGSAAGRGESRGVRLPKSPGVTTYAWRQQGRSERSENAIAGSAMEIITPVGHARGRAERLVLRSSDGTTRVTLTPAEKRTAREYMDDVKAVREL